MFSQTPWRCLLRGPDGSFSFCHSIWNRKSKTTHKGSEGFWVSAARNKKNIYIPFLLGDTYHKGNLSCFSFLFVFILTCLNVNNVMEAVRRMICSVKDNLLLSQCNIGKRFPSVLSLFSSPGESWREASWCYSFLFFFSFFFRSWNTFTAEECPHPPLKRRGSPQAPGRSRDCYQFL